jgi:hypothetical protein
MKLIKRITNNLRQGIAAMLIVALILSSWQMAGRVTAYSSPTADLDGALNKLRQAVSDLPARLFTSAVKKNLESEIERIRQAIKGVPCRAAKLAEDFSDDLGKLREGARTPYAEDLRNQAWAVRNDILGAIPKVSPCNDAPRFNRAPAINILESDNKHLRGRITFGEPKLWSVRAGGELFTQVQIPGLQSGIGQVGFPDVPVFHRLLAVPQGAKATVNFKPGQSSTLKLNLYPIQPEAADKSGKREFPQFENPPFTKNKEAYERNANFPAEVCDVKSSGKARDLQLAQLAVAAGQYNPVTEVLTLFESVEFEIVFQGGKGGFLPPAANNPFENTASYVSTLLNSEIIFKYPIGDIRRWVCFGEEYLILTHPDFRAAADRLAEWKNDKGIATRVFNVNDGGGAGPDTKEEIDAFIENRYGKCLTRPSYVLLLGDAEFIPTFYRDTYGSDTTGTDYPYALLGDDDETPDFALGRIPVDTLEEANTVVDKIIKYEQHPPSQSSFYQNVGVASQFQCCRTDVDQDGRDQRAFIETTEFVRDHLLDQGYGAARIYTETMDEDYTGDPAPRRFFDGTLLPAELRPSSGFAWDGSTADIVDAWNAGRFLFLHRDHGWQYGWGNPSFSSDNVVNDLNNGDLLPVVFSVNCASGLFDNEMAGGDYGTDVNETYFAEHLLRKSGGGAVGMLGDTRNSPTGPNNVLTKGFFDAVWPNLLPDFGDGTSKHRLGDILNHGKLLLISTYGLPAVTADLDGTPAASELYLWHVLGDPTLEMWTAKPGLKLIRHYDFILAQNYLLVKYELEGTLITAYQETKDGVMPLGRAEVRNGEARLSLIQQPVAGAAIQFSASLENDVSVRLGK